MSTDAGAEPGARGLGRWGSIPLLPPRLRFRSTIGPDAVAALGIYRPMVRRGRAAARVAQRLLSAGIAVPRRRPLDVSALLAHFGLDADGVAVMRSSHGERLLIGVAASGSLRAVLKVAPQNDPDLRRETEALGRLTVIGGGVSAPRVLAAGPWRDLFVLATEGVTPARDPAGVPLEEAARVCAVLARVPGVGPVVHGDLNPSNVLPTRDGFVLVDWEWCRFESDPLFDLTHFAARRGLLHRTDPSIVVRRLVERGSPGWTYLDAVGVDPAEAPALVHSYLMRANLPGRRGQRYRMAMWAELGRGLARSQH